VNKDKDGSRSKREEKTDLGDGDKGKDGNAVTSADVFIIIYCEWFCVLWSVHTTTKKRKTRSR